MATNGTAAEVISQEEVDRREIVEMARRDNPICDGELEIDDNAVVSHGSDNGAYVQAWVWVSFTDSRFDKDPSSAEASESVGLGCVSLLAPTLGDCERLAHRWRERGC